MAPPSLSSRNWVYDVFPSFSGEDVRKTFLNHFLKELDRKLITAFEENEIHRSKSLDPELKQAIRSSRVAVVVFSKNYASSSWCLNELLEIVKCKKELGQTLIPVFYGLDPSHVRKQTGDFGEAFLKTCENKTEEVKIRWQKALTDVANVVGYHSWNWDNEARMIEAIADDLLGRLCIVPSKDFDYFAGIEAHLKELSSLLDLKSEEVRMVGIWGPSGIGKTTIARSLFGRVSRHFQSSIFIDRAFVSKSMEMYSRVYSDDYSAKLHLQKLFLCEILDEKDIKIDHLGVVRDRLMHQKVLIVIDDLDDQEVLEALAGQCQWFGSGSRIIVVTKEKHFLVTHGIKRMYNVGLPSKELALEMLCRAAFRKNHPPKDLAELASKVTLHAGNRPLGLNVLGSYLQGRDKVGWLDMLTRLQNGLGKIEKTLKVSYDGLNNKKDQAIFRHIACLFSGEKVNDIKLLLEDSDLDVNIGLKNLIDKSLIHVREGIVEMHPLLQNIGREIVYKQSNEPGEREFLVDSKDICDVLDNNSGTKKILGMQLNIDEIDEFSISERAFQRMPNLRFLSIYTKKWGRKKEVRWHLPEFNYFPPKLRKLRLDRYPARFLPSNFRPENLVKLQMLGSKLEKLWEGVRPLKSLKIMDLRGSKFLKEIPDLSLATNLETLRLSHCSSLVELPFSIQYLHQLKKLDMQFCKSLETIPTGINLQSLDRLDLKGCSRLKSFPNISTNVSFLILSQTGIEAIPSKFRLENVVDLGMEEMRSEKLWEGVQPLTPLMTMLSPSLTKLWLSNIPSLEELPSSIQNFKKLEELSIIDCINLKTLPTGINLETLDFLDLKGCSRLKTFPNISTYISELYLDQTAMEEVPWWIENFSRLSCLYMKGCKNLQCVFLNLNKLKHLETVDFSDCMALTKASWNGSSNAVAMTTDSVHSKLLVPVEASSPFPDNYVPKLKLNLMNCLNLDQEAIYQQQSVFFKFMEVSGGEVPPFFTHRTSGTSLAIPLRDSFPSQRFFKFQACAVVDSESIAINYLSFDIKVCCRFRDKLGNYFGSADESLNFSPIRLGSHLVIFACCFFPKKDNAHQAEINYSQVDIQFHLMSDHSQLKLKECGIRILDDNKRYEVNLGGHETELSEDCGNRALEMPSSRNWRYDVFPSFSGEDVRETFLSHFLRELDRKSIIAFKDNEIGRSQSIISEHVQAIRDSRMAVVIFSNNYAYSSWCLDELLEITKCKKELGQLVLPIFYNLDPSDVRKQTGNFGKVFEKTCQSKTEEETQLWRQALSDVANTSGYDSVTWGNEAKMIDEIVSDNLSRVKLATPKNPTPSMEKIEMSHDHDTWFSRAEKPKELDAETDDILWDANSSVNAKKAVSVQGGAIFNKNSRRDEEILGEVNIDAAYNSQNSERQKPHGKVSESSTLVTYVRHKQQHQVFINFCGEEVLLSFVSRLVSTLSREGVNVFIRNTEKTDEDLGNIFQNIENSTIALVVFSSRYTESKWCLEELVKVKECMEDGRLFTIPIFYKVDALQVKQLEGDFGLKLWDLWRIHRDPDIIKWKDALESVSAKMGYCSKDHSSESQFINFIVKEVVKIPLWEVENPSFLPSAREGKTIKLSTQKAEKHKSFLSKCPHFGLEERMKTLEQKLEFDCNETRIIGVVGMAGIGKTTLAMMLHDKWNCKFVRCVPLLNIHKTSKDHRPAWLRKTLLEVLLGGKFPVINDETTHESLKDRLLQTKVFIVLDDVSDKEQLKFLLSDLKWIKKGSKIVISSRDKSVIEGFVHDTYMVPPLNYGEAIQLFSYHAFGDRAVHPTVTSMKLWREFVDCAGGNPLIIKLLGKQLHGRDEAQWKMSQGDLKHLDMVILDIFGPSYNELGEKHKKVFLDIACFFRSEDEIIVRSLLDSGDNNITANAASEVRDLTNKCMISISGCRVEMNDLFYMFGKIFSSQALIEENRAESRLWYTREILDAMIYQKNTRNIRGIFLDMSEVTKEVVLDKLTFTKMPNLRYLKLYDSCCPRPCKNVCKLNFPEGFKFPLKKVRYLHWVKFPLEDLPPDFKLRYLVDLRLPYSMIKRVWEDAKDAPRLKWVDLSHSNKLLNLSGLAKANSLERLNLEGCTSLDELPEEMHNMESLVYLNLRGCIRLSSLPQMDLTSLKTLILSNCSNLKKFQVISRSLEVLRLDGTAIKGLPLDIQNLQRLVLLNLKNCKSLKRLPNCLGKLKVLEELILSGCSKLKNIPDIRQSLKHVQILLLDGTGLDKMPNLSCFIGSEGQASVSYPNEWRRGFDGVSSLRRLCLSGSDFVNLINNIGQLYNLTWLDVKQCKKLVSVPMLPPRLQYFDAHGCDSLEKVAHPLAFLEVTEQAHAVFNFSNCNKLDQDAQDSIISYTRRRSQLMLGALSRYNGDSALEALTQTCFPGWEVPEWFSHRGSGSLLKPKLPPHWCDNRFTGIALCAVILFPGYNEQNSRLLVTCKCEFKNEDGSSIHFSCAVGGWNELSNTPQKMEYSHVFIGYTSRLDICKRGGYVEGGCFCTKGFFEFQVTDGTERLLGCEVLQCGFSLVYATDERETMCWDAKTVVIPKRIDYVPDEEKSCGNSQSDNDIQYQSYSDATRSSQRRFVNKRVDLFRNAGGEIIISSYHHNTPSENVEKPFLVGVELRLRQLEKVLFSTPGETRIVGVIGMPHVGKTTLANVLFEKHGCKFPRNFFLKVSQEQLPEDLKRMFLEELLGHMTQNIGKEKDNLLQTKAFVVLDNVNDKKQLEFLLGNLKWIKKGSKIVVTGCDKSLVEGLAHAIYVVPHLNNKEAYKVFAYHAFDGKICIPSKTVLSLSRVFVDSAGGNPHALELLGSELCGKDKAYWENKLEILIQDSNMKIQDVWRFYTDQLTEWYRDVFLDIACFFRSEDEYFIRSLLDSGDPDSNDDVNEVRDLAGKFLITISDGRVEMSDQLYTFSKNLGSSRWLRLRKFRDILNKLMKMNKQEANHVRGIFLDTSLVMGRIAMERLTFINMSNLRYLKVYESSCTRKGKSNCKVQFPDGFDFPLEEVRYFHWLNFPLEELPPDFRPKNLVDLRLPYSNVERLWEGVKDTPKLKWVDLSNSSKLLNLSALSRAENLQRFNLEGCTNLDELPREMQKMRSLVYLNVRGCIRLSSLPKMNLISLKTLILSDCSNLKEFRVISKSLEVLHLDGTAIKGLPLDIRNLQRLVLLNLKNCKMLECLPNCLGKLKALEELVLSGCSRLKNLPDVRHSMKHVHTLLFDGAGVDEMPNISCFFGSFRNQLYADIGGVNGIFSLRRLCLSGHDFICLHDDIGQMYNLTWLDVKQCKKLRSVPMLPPRLQHFDAHGCDSLEKVANPLAIQMLTEQIHATFNFSNCGKLDQDATDAIISYTQWKSQLILDALSRYNRVSTVGASIHTCFPGWDVPAWFSYRASGSLLEPKLPPHWCDSRFSGIALCAVILFPTTQNQRSNLLVTCKCVIKNEDGTRICFSYSIGGWSEPDKTIESSHVFIGYASKLDIKELREDSEGCFHTDASFEYQVTDGTKELEGCEVIECGLSLVYASDEFQGNSGEYRLYSTPAEVNQDMMSSRVQDFCGYLFLAFSCLIIFVVLSFMFVFAPKY